MQNTFDPYHKWLGIPPEEQPPTLYRLLGVAPFEGDPDVIHAAADGRMGFLKTFQTGANSAVAERLLNEVSRARICLVNPEKKTAYDNVLRSAKPADAGDGPPPKAGKKAAAAATGKKGAGGQTFGQFRILQLIHAGPLGQVFKAVHQPSGTLVSLKVLPTKSAKNDELARRFRREQEVTCKLDHPNLIAGYDAGKYRGVPYLVTEFVMGTDLGTIVNQHGPLPVEQAVDYTLQAARGLMQLHLHGVYHRNIKPQVLWINMGGQLKITNLFLAKISDHATVDDGQDDLTQMGQMMGTVEYLPPEQAMDAKSADQRADIYALGCTLHFLLTGQPPYPGRSMMEKLAAHRTEPIPSLRAKLGAVPANLEEAFTKMLAKDTATRYQFMGDVVGVLEQRRRPTFFRRLLDRCLSMTKRSR